MHASSSFFPLPTSFSLEGFPASLHSLSTCMPLTQHTHKKCVQLSGWGNTIHVWGWVSCIVQVFHSLNGAKLAAKVNYKLLALVVFHRLAIKTDINTGVRLPGTHVLWKLCVCVCVMWVRWHCVASHQVEWKLCVLWVRWRCLASYQVEWKLCELCE